MHILVGESSRCAAWRAGLTSLAIMDLLHAPPETNDGLTPREVEVLRLLVQGLANKEIAAQMDVSESTVKNTLQQLFAKTNVRTRAQLVRVALENYRDEL